MAEEGVVENDIDEDAIDDSGAQQPTGTPHAEVVALTRYQFAPYQTLLSTPLESS
jgi:pyrimidine deaminase RibD-like protein